MNIKILFTTMVTTLLSMISLIFAENEVPIDNNGHLPKSAVHGKQGLEGINGQNGENGFDASTGQPCLRQIDLIAKGA